jgi:hypothetical protein
MTGTIVAIDPAEEEKLKTLPVVRVELTAEELSIRMERRKELRAQVSTAKI